MPPQTIRIPYDSNLRYLPLVYLLPEDLMSRCPTLMKIPRNPYQVLQSNEWLDLIDSDQFLDEIMDAVSSLVFPFFGFRGWKEHYTGDFPVWRLSYSMPLWAKGVEQEIGWNLQRLFQLPRNAEIVFLPEKQIKALFEKIVKKVIAEQGWQPMLDALHEMPCDEDFEKQRTSCMRCPAMKISRNNAQASEQILSANGITRDPRKCSLFRWKGSEQRIGIQRMTGCFTFPIPDCIWRNMSAPG